MFSDYFQGQKLVSEISGKLESPFLSSGPHPGGPPVAGEETGSVV